MSIAFVYNTPDNSILETTALPEKVDKTAIIRWLSGNNRMLPAGHVFQVNVFSDQKKDRLTATARFRVTIGREVYVRAERAEGAYEGDHGSYRPQIQLHEIEPWIRYGEDGLTLPVLEVVNKGPVHKWWVLDEDKNPVAKGLPEEDARAIAAYKMPLPKAA